ncbi:uncharacterized protein STEHIDRAFT_127868 [Stereum hirsutum FP-91666 SS1]|uniref:uncharacterized protein n=1 Tax=Stereum hirsutum (strain FP-91666) TaxID=721885 RepID=UPI000440F0E0|nr:uncharacterized protein STEHIDRAFT_127868 [Stereum hirsutum FP-91666 SS1]EIM90794.1 hypothetical protein STEHIDRAFT_127868 [Stereum hirsutum FP-91666 SS1]
MRRHLHGFASRMDKSSFRPRWGFVLRLVKDKLVKAENGGGWKGNETDSYWLMRARLGLAKVKGVELDACEDTSERSVYHARERFLDDKLSVWDAHSNVPYLRALLAIKRPSSTKEVVSWICFYLDTSPSQSIVNVLYDILLDAGLDLSSASKEALLSTVWRRITRKLPKHLPSSDARYDLPDGDSWDESVFTSDGGASSLVQEVRQAVFFPRSISPSGPGTAAQKILWNWARHQALIMFDPNLSSSTRWHNLTLLASANSSAVTVPDSALSSASHSPIVSADFRILAVLAILERLVSSSYGEADAEIRLFVRGVWRLWYKAIGEDRTIHPAKIRPLISSFLHLSRFTKDNRLRLQCLELADSGFYNFDIGDDFAKRQVQILAANAMAAAEACGQLRWQEGLPGFVVREGWQDVLSRLAIPRLARVDALRAHELHQRWMPHLEVTQDVAEPIATGLIHAGRMDLALPFLSILRFEGRRGHRVLETVLQAVHREQNRFIDFGLAQVLARALKSLYSATPAVLRPPSRLRRPLSFALLALVNAGHAATASDTYKNIRSAQPSYFSTAFDHALMKCLCSNRQFRLAVRLVDDVDASPAVANEEHKKALREALLISLVRSGRGASRLAGYVGKKSGDRTLAVVRNRAMKIAFKLRGWTSPSRAGRPSPRDFERSRVLIPLAHRLGSSHILADDSSITPKMRTYLGNVLIYERLSRRRRERPRDRLRAALETLDDLMRGRKKKATDGGSVHVHGKRPGRDATDATFVPDRVTMNIVLSGMLAWVKEWDVMKVRMLFDLLVRCGYPAGERFSKENAPFGSSRSRVDERIYGDGGLAQSQTDESAPLEAGAINAEGDGKGKTEDQSRGQGVMDWVELLRIVMQSGEEIHFGQHVRPMLRMFIKALYVRGDKTGARILVGILKDVETTDNRETVERRRRSVGDRGGLE